MGIKRDRMPLENRISDRQMIELLRTNDLVYLSFIRHVLGGAGVDFVVLDEYTSAAEGSINAIPRRVLVAESARDFALELLGNHSLTNSQ